MTEPITRIYVGPFSRGRQLVAGESIGFTRGEPTEVSAAVAKVLDTLPEWSTPKPPAVKQAKSQGDTPTTKEP